ncbi:glycoside hydrolase family 16 protein [Aurantiacibacter gangjinensis]|uniref:glycoside hydrolase family 16 protein n=1 Tax=Aurantiacibacter gangjinensis TaxID=502682 RepID=UPI0009E38F52|nr:glycoside hydrolase family 16 protein [Aurantiacibacter gangjinensis]
MAGCGGGSSSGPAPQPIATATPTPTPTTATGSWQLVWSDEFDGTTLDPANWTASNDCWGGGNEERQCYTPRPENVRLENGTLVLTARSEQWTGPAWPASFGPGGVDPNEQRSKPYTSGKVTSENLASWTYGRFEIRARFPQGQGMWPAIWMLPEESHYGSWAASGEIDILETVNPGVTCPGCEAGGENSIYGTLHFGGQWPDNANRGTDLSFPGLIDGEFHTYGIVWEQGRIIWTVDGEAFASMTSADWFTSATTAPDAPFDRAFHLILNLAVGGRWPESQGLGGVSDSGFPKRMEVDWVRVYECDADPATGRGCVGE